MSPSKQSPWALIRNVLFQSPLPCFHALLEGFLQDRSELSHHGCCNGFLVLKTSSFDDFLEFGKHKEDTRVQSRVVVPVQQCYFWQETPKFPTRHYELEHCHDEAAMTSFPTVRFFSP